MTLNDYLDRAIELIEVGLRDDCATCIEDGLRVLKAIRPGAPSTGSLCTMPEPAPTNAPPGEQP